MNQAQFYEKMLAISERLGRALAGEKKALEALIVEKNAHLELTKKYSDLQEKFIKVAGERMDFTYQNKLVDQAKTIINQK